MIKLNYKTKKDFFDVKRLSTPWRISNTTSQAVFNIVLKIKHENIIIQHIRSVKSYD